MPRRSLRQLSLCLPLWLMLCWLPASADEGDLRVRFADSYLRDGVYLLNMAADIRMPGEPRKALDSGVPLVFAIDIELQRTREWFPNAVQHEISQRYRLTYHGLSRRYRVENINTGVRDSFRSLESALWHIGTLRDFPLVDRVLLRESRHYLGTLQIYLDISELPLPLRPQAYLSSEWRFSSEVFQWSVK
jgi:hypothetical protein